MSSFLVSEKSIENIASVLCAIANDDLPGTISYRINKYNIMQAADNITGGEPLTQRKACWMLYSLNVRALLTRYNDNPEEYNPEKIGYSFKRKPSGAILLSQSKHQLYKTVQCFLYQCCESDQLINDPVYRIITELKHTIAEYIIETIPQYESADWE